MTTTHFSPEELAVHYRLEPAAAWARVRFPDLSELAADGQVTEAVRRGLDLHMFKRTRLMPRVSATLGLLQGLGPADLLDLGTGRGSFLWPLLDALPDLPVTCADIDPQSIERVQAVASIRPAPLHAHCMDVTDLDFEDRAFDCVTLLETLEHIPQPDAAMKEALRVARR
jgi:2-polyprenyl-3-methyl-5-hydroxy-6-metoxy-1,4-benzoquinol methylase